MTQATQKVFVTALCVVSLVLSNSEAINPIPYTREGVLAWNVGPPTPFYWNKTDEMMIFESVRYCGAGGSYWPPGPDGELQPYSNHSYFRIRDMLTGEVVSNVEGSECYAYGSAMVDPVLGRAWVFGSERDLCHASSDGASNCSRFWQGRKVAGNGVRAWWSDDLVTWQTSAEPALTYKGYPFNTDATVVVGKAVTVKRSGRRMIVASASSDQNRNQLNFVLVSEHGIVAVHMAPDRNLTKGWSFFSQPHKTGFGACPSVHYSEEDGYFYLISGGVEISLTRTLDFVTWEQTSPLVTYDHSQDTIVSSYLGIAEQYAGNHPATAEHRAAIAVLRENLARPECWEYFVNDADFCCGGPLTGGGAPLDRAYILYSPSSQGHSVKSNCSSIHPKMSMTDFNGVAYANVSLTKLLQSRFRPH